MKGREFMYTQSGYEKQDYQKDSQETPVDMDALLEEQEWLNFKLGLFAEY